MLKQWVFIMAMLYPTSMQQRHANILVLLIALGPYHHAEESSIICIVTHQQTTMECVNVALM
jgi:hypothetical protein